MAALVKVIFYEKACQIAEEKDLYSQKMMFWQFGTLSFVAFLVSDK